MVTVLVETKPALGFPSSIRRPAQRDARRSRRLRWSRVRARAPRRPSPARDLVATPPARSPPPDTKRRAESDEWRTAHALPPQGRRRAGESVWLGAPAALRRLRPTGMSSA